MRQFNTVIMSRIFNFCIFISLVCVTKGSFGSELKTTIDHCFCKLKGSIDDCSCTVDTVDHYNNVKLAPRLHSLLRKDYFRFYKANLRKACPFWSDDSMCAIPFCHVQPCLEKDIPVGLKGNTRDSIQHRNAAEKYSEAAQTSDCEHDHDNELGYINTTISDQAYEEFARWQEHDNVQYNFCEMNGEDEGAEYVDLLLNPERYTGYKGKSAHRIWRSIYMENCFRPQNSANNYIQSSLLTGMCLEKRAFYRAISGLHSSINIHLSSRYLLSDKNSINLENLEGVWGPKLSEFEQRFNPVTTNNEGPGWLRNLYFLYLLELRALAKAAPYLANEEYYTGNDEEDMEVKQAVGDFLKIARSFPDHFNESTMFTGGKQAYKLKEEFRQHFRNISRIMDCVGCEKCKLWGKLQIQGLGTALKILFSGKFDTTTSQTPGSDLNFVLKNNFQLQRNEIVALFNAFGRLSNSIMELEHFRMLMR